MAHEPFSLSIRRVHLDHPAILVHSVASILEVLVKWCLVVSENVILLLVVFDLDWDSTFFRADHTICKSNLVKEDMWNLTILEFIYVWLPLEDVDMARSVIWTRFENCQHFFNENTIHIAIHVKDFFKLWEFIDFAPGFWSTICNDRVFRFWLLLSILSITCCDCLLLVVSQLCLVFLPIEYLQPSPPELIHVIVTLLIKFENELFHFCGWLIRVSWVFNGHLYPYSLFCILFQALSLFSFFFIAHCREIDWSVLVIYQAWVIFEKLLFFGTENQYSWYIHINLIQAS